MRKNPEKPLVVMDLGFSHHCAQVLTTPVKIIGNIPHRNKRDFLKKGMGISVSIKPGHMAKSVSRIRFNAKFYLMRIGPCIVLIFE